MNKSISQEEHPRPQEEQGLTYSKLKRQVTAFLFEKQPIARNKQRKRVYDNLEDLRVLSDAQNRIHAITATEPSIDDNDQYTLFDDKLPGRQLRTDPVYRAFTQQEDHRLLARMTDRTLTLDEYWSTYKELERGPHPAQLLGLTHANYTRKDLIGGAQ